MRARLSREVALAALCTCMVSAAAPGVAQSPQPAANASPTQQQPANPAQPQRGKVIFSRSAQEPAREQAGQAASQAKTPEVTDAEREALTFTAYDFDIRLMPRQSSLAVRAQVRVRNDGSTPLRRLTLQLSSTLRWESVHTAGKAASFAQHAVKSDADHTGTLNEAVVELAEPLMPRQERVFDVVYSGQVAPTAKRLESIGTPTDVAAHADWDEIDLDFVGLRGFGNVVWYPVSSAPVALGDGARLFEAIGQQKLRQSAALVSMQVSEEFYVERPNIAVLNGQPVPVKVVSAPTASFPGVAKCELPARPLGFELPGITLAVRREHLSQRLHAYARIENEGNVPAYETATGQVYPLLDQWLGARPESALTLIDLPQPDDSPMESGSVLEIGLSGLSNGTDATELAQEMSHALTHAYFHSPRAWLNEGVANFMGSLWIEQSLGREKALEWLESLRGGLALAEPAGIGTGQPVVAAYDPVYYRSKATYILWMLRAIAGDKALAAALTAYDPGKDHDASYFEQLLEQASHQDLKWFFDDWVYRDQGLPDLSIANVFPSKTSVAGQYLVAVDVTNDGYAVADVAVTVRSAGTTSTERMRIPARSKEVHRMLIQGEPVEVLVNDGTVPEVQASVHRRLLTEAAASPAVR